MWRKQEAGTYQSIHLSLTGIRSVFAPLLGVLFFELFGFAVTFGIAIVVLIMAIGVMVWSYRKEKVI